LATMPALNCRACSSVAAKPSNPGVAIGPGLTAL
jgi:hypothetical protein